MPTDTPHSRAGSSRTTRILIVEDERHIARMVQYFLTKAGYDVQAVNDAEEASETIARFEPDVLLLDLVLPGMSGFDFLEALRKEAYNPNLIVIVLSAHWFSPDDPTLARAGATAQCAKPIAPTKLLRQLEELGAYPDRRQQAIAATKEAVSPAVKARPEVGNDLVEAVN